MNRSHIAAALVLGALAALTASSCAEAPEPADLTTEVPLEPAAGCIPACSSGNSCCAPGCYNLQTDTHHCGSCSNDCCPNPGLCLLRCSAGHCCVAGATYCPGAGCKFFSNDPLHCGGCGNVCNPPANATATCVSGSCDFTCNAGFTRCGNQCVDTKTDEANCNGCGIVCNGSCTNGHCCPWDHQTWCPSSNGSGQCQSDGAGGYCCNTPLDPLNCGTCGTVCHSPGQPPGNSDRCCGGDCFVGANSCDAQCCSASGCDC